ncbi:MAG: NAD-glutamate dehydrogenase, partial [Phycisphaeraceae bacterium]|nr:NAD-glutamate dehydrogenase [Phycisphaeraceae bacterium]
GGVNCSDHEVNIKILLRSVEQQGEMTREERNELLVSMTEEVGRHVCERNRQQVRALALSRSQAGPMVNVHRRLIKWLEAEADLDRELEAMPGDDQLARRHDQDRGLYLPELSVLLAYHKLSLSRRLLASTLPDTPYARGLLDNYFPKPLREPHADAIKNHRLAEEIIATEASNEINHRGGITFVFRLHEETGATPSEIAHAYFAARDMYGLDGVWDQLEALAPAVPSTTQTQMLLESRRLLGRATRWLLRNQPRPLPIESTIKIFADGLATLAERLPELTEGDRPVTSQFDPERWRRDGAPEELVDRLALSPGLFAGLDIITVAREAGRDVITVAEIYFDLSRRLSLLDFWEQVLRLPRDTRWEALARAALRDDLYRQQRDLTTTIVGRLKDEESIDDALE